MDSFAETRQKDVLNLAQELEYEHEKDKKSLGLVILYSIYFWFLLFCLCQSATPGNQSQFRVWCRAAVSARTDA